VVAVSLNPTKMIAQTFQLKRSTTGYWFGKARQAGYRGCRTGRRDSNGPDRHARRAPLSSALGRRKTLGSAPKIFTPRTVAEDKIAELEASRLDGSYVDHKNKITVAECAGD
jgi:hypothetical protein